MEGEAVLIPFPEPKHGGKDSQRRNLWEEEEEEEEEGGGEEGKKWVRSRIGE